MNMSSYKYFLGCDLGSSSCKVAVDAQKPDLRDLYDDRYQAYYSLDDLVMQT